MAISVFPRVDVSGTNRWSPLRRGHWSTQDLVLCYPFGQGVPASLYPVTHLGEASSAPATGKASPHGVTFDDDTQFLSLVEAALVPALIPASRITVLCVRQCADTTLRTGGLFGTAETGTTTRLSAFVPLSDGTIYWDCGGSGVAGGRLTVAFTKTADVEAWAFIAGASGSAIYRNGLLLASSATAVAGGWNTSTAFKLNSCAGTGDLQTVHFFAVLNAEWTAPQVAEWAAHPWLMFGTESWRTVPGVAGLALDTVAGAYAVTGSAADLLAGGAPGGQTYAWAYVG